MAIPAAAVPPFAPQIEDEYEQARATIRHALDELYRAVQILSTQATDTDGFATDDDITNLQTQIDNLDVVVAGVAVTAEAPEHLRRTGGKTAITARSSLVVAGPYEILDADVLEIKAESLLVVL